MPDYSKGKIYAIRTHKSDDVYIGSTTQPLHKRLASHVAIFNSRLSGNLLYNFVTSLYVLEQGDYYIELIKNYPCETKEKLNRKEGHYIRKTENCVNKCIAGRGYKEWYQENKDKVKKATSDYYHMNKEKVSLARKSYEKKNRAVMLEYYNNYYKEHKDEQLKKQKEHYETNKSLYVERGKAYREKNKEIIKQRKMKYREENKEKITERKKKYYEDNKVQINERRKVKVKCECGAVVLKQIITRHKQSKKHQKYEEEINN